MISYTENKILWNRLYQLTQELPTVNRKQEIRELFRLLVPELNRQINSYGKEESKNSN